MGLLERWYELDGHLPPEAIVSLRVKFNLIEISNDRVFYTFWFNPGMITVGGQNAREMDLIWWRSQIGLV